VNLYKKSISTWFFCGDWDLKQKMISPVPFYKYAPELLIDNTSRAMNAIFKLA
jgi:hypothetical protein